MTELQYEIMAIAYSEGETDQEMDGAIYNLYNVHVHVLTRLTLIQFSMGHGHVPLARPSFTSFTSSFQPQCRRSRAQLTCVIYTIHEPVILELVLATT